MIRSLIAFALALAALLLAAPEIRARDFAGVKSAGTLRMSNSADAPPFYYMENGQLTGFEVELGNALAVKLGLQPEWKPLSFDALLIGLNQDRFDLVIASHSPTPERSKSVDFLEPHYCSGAVLVARKGGPLSLDQLRGKTVAVQVGTTYYQKARAIEGIGEVKTFPADTQALQSLLAGRVDAWMTDKFSAIAAIKKNPDSKLEQGEFIYPEALAMAVAKGNHTLEKAVESALAELLQDGTYAALSRKYFAADIRCR